MAEELLQLAEEFDELAAELNDALRDDALAEAVVAEDAEQLERDADRLEDEQRAVVDRLDESLAALRAIAHG